MCWIIHHFKTDFALPVQRPRTPAGVDPSGNCRSSHYVELGRKAVAAQCILRILLNMS